MGIKHPGVHEIRLQVIQFAKKYKYGNGGRKNWASENLPQAVIKKYMFRRQRMFFRMFQVDSFCLNNKFLQRGLVNYSESKRRMRCKLILIWPQVVLWAGSGWSKMFANNSRMFKFQFNVEKIVLKLPKKHTLINWSSKND